MPGTRLATGRHRRAKFVEWGRLGLPNSLFGNLAVRLRPNPFTRPSRQPRGLRNMKALIFTLAVAIFPCAAQAGEAVTYMVDGETLEGYRAAASGDSKGLVLIIHDWDGLTEYEMKRADMLADMGYDAFAVDLFGKGNRPIETEAKKKETGKLYQDRDRMRSLIVGGLQEARKSNDKKTVVMGYCFGG